ncbi:ABC transporter permease [Ensifer soli]|uniref:ABC transporter permease n=1 Tax=Ciceribacter sp. sgz301302 TaxID=3342379 RepID=UPI0035BB44FF
MVFSKTAFTLFLTAWVVLLLVPVAALVLWSFLAMENYQFVAEPTLSAYGQIVASGRDLVIWKTLRIAVTVTLIELVVAIPFSIWLAKKVTSAKVKAIVLTLLTIPFFISIASRTMVFRPILSRNGPVNTALIDLGLIDRPLEWLLFSDFSVHLGLLGPSFPTMVLPIYLTMTLIDDELINAARDLGAPPHRVFLDVMLPLALPGIVAGIIFTFVPMLGETVVPQLLGGGNVNMLGSSLASLIQVVNYPVAAALSVVVLLVVAVLLVLLRLLMRRLPVSAPIFEGTGR